MKNSLTADSPFFYHVQNSMLLPLVKEFILQRHSIFESRQKGLENIYTKIGTSKILSEEELVYKVFKNTRFGNVYRILNRSNQEILYNIMFIKNSSLSDAERVSSIYLYRLLDKKIFQEICTELPSDKEEAIELLQYLQNRYKFKEDSNIFRDNADRYIVSKKGSIGNFKLTTYLSILGDILDSPEIIYTLLYEGLKEKYLALVNIEGFTKFLAYEFALDFSYATPDFDYNEYDFFVVIDKHTNKIMKEVFPLLHISQFRGMCAFLAKTNYFDLKYEGRVLRASDVANCFKEFERFLMSLEDFRLHDQTFNRIYTPNEEKMLPIIWNEPIFKDYSFLQRA